MSKNFGKYTISKLSKRFIPEAASVLTNAFMNEPTTKAMGYSQFIVKHCLKREIEGGIVYAARMNDNNEIAGVLLCEDYSHPDNVSYFAKFGLKTKISDWVFPMHQILDDLNLDYMKQKIEVERLKCARISELGVLDKYQRMGISINLMEFGEKDLKETYGFNLAWAEATNIKSERMLAEKLGYKTQRIIDYRTWRNRIAFGWNPFKSIPKEHNLVLMDKEL